MGRTKIVRGRIQGSWGRIKKETVTEGKPLHAEQ
jgi:hypothetical protein